MKLVIFIFLNTPPLHIFFNEKYWQSYQRKPQSKVENCGVNRILNKWCLKLLIFDSPPPLPPPPPPHSPTHTHTHTHTFLGSLKNLAIKIEMSGQALGIVQGLSFGQPFFKVLCYLYSSVDCFHIFGRDEAEDQLACRVQEITRSLLCTYLPWCPRFTFWLPF